MVLRIIGRRVPFAVRNRRLERARRAAAACPTQAPHPLKIINKNVDAKRRKRHTVFVKTLCKKVILWMPKCCASFSRWGW